MAILVCLVSIFFIFLVLQVMIWRIKLPKNQTSAILKLYLAVLGMFLVGQALGGFNHLTYFNLSWPECIYLSIVYIAVLPTYGILYTMVEAESPSSLMALALEEARDQGLVKTAFQRIVTDDLFILNRVVALQKGGHIFCEKDSYFITTKGVAYMRLFLIPRHLMGRQEYGG